MKETPLRFLKYLTSNGNTVYFFVFVDGNNKGEMISINIITRGTNRFDAYPTVKDYSSSPFWREVTKSEAKSILGKDFPDLFK